MSRIGVPSNSGSARSRRQTSKPLGSGIIRERKKKLGLVSCARSSAWALSFTSTTSNPLDERIFPSKMVTAASSSTIKIFVIVLAPPGGLISKCRLAQPGADLLQELIDFERLGDVVT